MHRGKEKFSGSKKNDFSWMELILLSFLTCIAILLLYSSFNRHTEDTVVKESKITTAAGQIEINKESGMD